MTAKKKFSIIDLAIILAFICIVGGIIFRTYIKNNIFENSDITTIEYTLEIKNTDKQIRKLINNGDHIYSTKNNSCVGTIVKCDRKASSVYVKGEDNNMITVSNTAGIDITLTVRTQATKTQQGYSIDGQTYILPGYKDRFTSKKCEFDAQITSVKSVSDNIIG